MEASSSNPIPKTGMPNPIEDFGVGIGKGIAKEVLENPDKLQEVLDKFIHRKLAFVQDPAIIRVLIEEKSSYTFNYYKKYIKDITLRDIVLTGLALRKFTKINAKHQIDFLREKILFRYKVRGLRIAEVVASEVLSKYVADSINNATSGTSDKDLTKMIEDMLWNSYKFVIFVQGEDWTKERQRAIIAPIYSNKPNFFAIACTWKARKIGRKIIKTLKNGIGKEYDCSSVKAAGEEVTFMKKL